MDSKQPIPPASYEEDEGPAPPAYSEGISPSSYYSTQIRDQLSTLTSQITSLQTQKSLLSHAHDEKILSLLTTQIQIFLSEFANSGLKRGTLILVPANGMTDEKAMPTDYDFRDPDEYDRVVRVRSKEDVVPDEWSGETGEMWYWRDEDMARRLAQYLKPPPDPRDMELPPRKEELVPQPVEGRASPARGFWGRKKSVTMKPPLLAVNEQKDVKVDSDSKLPSTSEESEDRVMMDVKADEVVFRTENDFGIYGTERGWGIVLTLRLSMKGSRR
ncbi:hypothetical protein G7Y89_g13282 [Cudoniella acicularis]|uniref:Uncharacterized protein n=1 Tax=Cudoniella acicularis TaxID=354080 RepID=A0A8H4R776_9HELO|nr:hypothetical protein G7Y89_g13282 [Cudoniella acicularis]